ncbi:MULTISPECIES: Na(+)/H(+) antiporter subunit C [Sporosarcina]|uniref:Cation:proton antiporter n=1 Tax=Sporosarcina ureae TaxID=1571 RepID=A0ABN4YSW1_SPOUR|nr:MULTISPECIES: Na(+)/H(+) antiporter subunit C [Sporosarcina]ARF13486.1 cation:proton antiporter [Sporosarcina ureae]PIC56640.1 Na(+)/H(+) antiporter subunit C [Sporosarcina sp. P10]PIC59856.1 Na(+)/H(+) antiporter subunit C [Sporosarcina sp. P12(2017)]PIC75541.1 Na(+)/H(+) antiporter subunit C [Sporosarcina sp. P19]
MEFILSILIGILFTAAVYLILSRSLLKVILGTGLLSHGAHLLILTMGGLGGTAPPVVIDGVTDFADPLPQALILTAIVISFGVTAVMLVMAYRMYDVHRTDNMNELRGNDEHD